jgi:hypothetical protein
MFLKVAMGLLLTLPLGAYIAGTLVASQVDMPQERPAVVIDSRSSGISTPTPTSTPTPSPRPDPTRSPDDDNGGDDDHGGNSGHGGGDDVRVVRPTPRDVDEDYLDDLADEREDRADDLADEREDRSDDRADDD